MVTFPPSASAQKKGAGVADSVARGVKATALIEIPLPGGRAFGSAFCVDVGGLFVTNAHVVEPAVTSGAKVVTLVLDGGEKTERVVKARILDMDVENDLALLKIDPIPGLSPLSLGQDKDLSLTMEVAFFGFPFGGVLAPADQYPSISVNRGHITSLRKVGGKLGLIQLDGDVNPGNSGGPVLGAGGRVVGVIVAKLNGAAGINFAIPVGVLADYLKRPIIVFDPPPIDYLDRSKPVDWTISVLRPGVAGTSDNLAVAIKVTAGTGPQRSFVAKSQGGGAYTATVVPVPAEPDQRLNALVRLGGQAFEGKLADQAFQVGGKEIRLGDVRSLIRAPSPGVTLADGKVLSGPITGLAPARLTADKATYMVDLGRSSSVQVRPREVVLSLEATIVVKKGTIVMGTKTLQHTFSGSPAAGGVPQGKGEVYNEVAAPPRGPGTEERLLNIGGDLGSKGIGARRAGESVRPPELAMGEALSSADEPVPLGEFRKFKGHTGIVQDAAVSPDGALVLSASDDGTARLWDLRSGAQTVAMGYDRAIGAMSVAFSPDGSRIAYGLRDGGIQINPLGPSGELTWTVPPTSPEGDVTAVVAITDPAGLEVLHPCKIKVRK
ncbi:MAG: mucD 8 [Planctomycetota bacterium]|nr:mucD 8 [Planctomycetota bacterium]